MSEIWLAPSEGKNGERQLRVAHVRGEELDFTETDLAAAELIEYEQRLTGVNDAEATTMMRLYSGQPVEEALFAGLDSLVNALDPADELLGAVSRQQTDEESGHVHSRFNVLYEAVSGTGTIDRSQVMFLGRTGLAVYHISGDPGRNVVVDDYDTVTDDTVVRETAAAYGLPHVAFQYELVEGAPDEYGTYPELLSRRTHYALGRLLATGEFEYVVAVLSEDHPVRQ